MKLSAISILVLFINVLALHPKTVIYIDSSKKYQIIDGWEAVANSLEATSVRDTLLPHINKLIDLAVNEVGITRLRYSYKSGMEDSVDFFSKVLSGEISYDKFKEHRYSKINDNDDPFVANPSGFKTSGLDYSVQNLIIPFKEAVEKNGDSFYFNLCFVDFKYQSEFHHTDDPEEYAEFIVYAFRYLDSIYNFVPDGIEIILEPDNADVWNHKHIPMAIAATGARLDLYGYNPEIIAPSVKNLRNIPLYFDSISENENALSYLDVLSYHRYSGNNDTAAQKAIVRIAEQHNLKTAMLEYDKNGDVNELHYDLKYNNVVAWTKYALMYKSDEKYAYVFVNATDSLIPQFGICKQTMYLRQYFKFIRPGAQRIGATSSFDKIDPVAFENLSGNQVVVIKAEIGEDIYIEGLAPGEYGVKYTLGNYNWGAVAPKEYDVDLSDQIIKSGQSISFNIPEKGIATVYRKTDYTSVAGSNDNKNLQIYPNPSNDYIDIILPLETHNASYIFEIYNKKGDLLHKETKNNSPMIRIRIKNLSAGSYIIRCKQSGKHFSRDLFMSSFTVIK